LHGLIRKILSRNEIIDRRQFKKGYFLTFIRLYKQDLKNRFLRKVSYNPAILHKLNHICFTLKTTKDYKVKSLPK
jgi:hypothetical protein